MAVLPPIPAIYGGYYLRFGSPPSPWWVARVRGAMMTIPHMKKYAVGLSLLLCLAACTSDPVQSAENCADLSDVDLASLSAGDLDQYADRVLEFAESALADNTPDWIVCNQLVEPLDQLGVVVDLEELDRD